MLSKNVQKQIRKLNMIEPNDKVFVGLSGGADSVALALLLNGMKDELGFSLEAIHVEHGIRGEESKADATFVEAFCKEQQICCHSFSIDVPVYAKENGLGLEEAARLMRYDIFISVAKEMGGKIALAHHMEDNAETILFQMARGSSLNGLCGMQPIRQDASGVTYIRPLLMVHRKELEEYLAEVEQRFCTDSTNGDLEYSRNYIRNVILPNMTKVNKQAVSHINESANYLLELRDFMEKEVHLVWEQLAVVDENIVLDLNKLQSLHGVLQKEIIYKAIGLMAGGKKDISSVHVEQVLALLDHQSGKEVSLPNQLVAIRENKTIRLLHVNKESDKRKEASILVEAEDLKSLVEKKDRLTLQMEKGCFELCVFEKSSKELEIPRKTYTKWFDYDRIRDGFCIRTRRTGDYFIYDAKGHRKKLKQYFVDEKIPVTKRDDVLVLANADAILWVVGGRISEDVKVTEETKIILEITYKEENK